MTYLQFRLFRYGTLRSARRKLSDSFDNDTEESRRFIGGRERMKSMRLK